MIQMKGQRIAPSAQLDSIQNPKRLGVLFATKLHTYIIFIVMMILKTSNDVKKKENWNENATAGVAAVIEIVNCVTLSAGTDTTSNAT